MKSRVSVLLIAVFALVSAHAVAAETRAGWWRGRKIAYKVVNGKAIRQGDMVLRFEDISSEPPINLQSKANFSKDATFIGQSRYLWPDATVPYAIGAGVPAKVRDLITNAIKIYTDNTPIRWVPRTAEANFVMFRSVPAATNECGDALVGMNGGQQDLNLNIDTTLCGVNTVIHEMGHTIGFEHEQTRANRNYYIKVHYENADKLSWDQYDQDLSQTDLLPYEYASIMHYGAYDFQRNNLNTIETRPLGIPIQSDKGLSAGDIEAIRTMYGQPSTSTTIATNPPGLQVMVDGAAITTPQTFNWAPGTRHTLNVTSAPQPGPAGVRYAFARWSNDGQQIQTIVASTANRVLTANFSTQFRVQASVAGAGGTVSLSPASADGYYTQGTILSMNANPSSGFSFLNWTGSTSIFTADSDNPTRFTVNATFRYVANFATAPITTIGSNFSNMTALVDGKPAYLPSNFSWTPGSTHTIEIKDAVQPTGTEGLPVQYAFLNWSNGGSASQTITAGAVSTAITAMWKRQFLVSTYVSYPDPNGSNGGRVTVNPRSGNCLDTSDCYYDEGATITITAIPTNPYALAYWGSNTNFGEHSDDLTGTAASNTIQVKDQVVAAANFQVPGTLNPAGITNAANYQDDSVAPGQIVTLFGLQFGPGALTTMQVSGGIAANTLAQTRILFDGAPAPLIYVSPNQISAIVPYAVAGRIRTSIQVEYQGKPGNAVSFPVRAAYPALFTLDSSGGGQGAILNQNYSVNSKTNPAARGSVIQLFGTGEGVTAPAGVDGKLAAAAPLPVPVLPVRVTIAGREAEVQYAGAAPDDVAGVIQINAFIPADCPTGNVPVTISVGNNASPENVTIAVQ